MAERLERLLVSERRLLEDISHELRSPLARMKLAVKLARTSADPSAALDRVEREVNRIAALTAEIVEVTRLEGDPRLLKLDSVYFRGLVQEAVSDCCGEVEPRVCNIRVDAQFSGQVSCDRELLRRAVENLLRNAIRYSPEHAPIDIRLAQNIRNVRLWCAIMVLEFPINRWFRFFEPFFRVDEARQMASGGVGLGLSIVERVAGTPCTRNGRRAQRLSRFACRDCLAPLEGPNVGPSLPARSSVPRELLAWAAKSLLNSFLRFRGSSGIPKVTG